MISFRPLLVALIAACAPAAALLPGGPPQSPEPLEPAKPGPATQPPSVVVIGASLAGGPDALLGARASDGSEEFADLHVYPDVLEHLEPTWEFDNLGDTWLFTQPELLGDEQIEAALDIEADIILALDFPFWFSYGGRADAERVNYLRDEGLSRLEALWDGLDPKERPLVLVGRLPDVRDTPVLSSSQKPNDESLAALNAELDAWIERHENVVLVPFASKLAKLRSGEAVSVCATEYTSEDIATLLLNDKLHPSTKGAALVAAMCLETLQKTGVPLETDVTELDVRALSDHLISAAKGEPAR